MHNNRQNYIIMMDNRTDNLSGMDFTTLLFYKRLTLIHDAQQRIHKTTQELLLNEVLFEQKLEDVLHRQKNRYDVLCYFRGRLSETRLCRDNMTYVYNEDIYLLIVSFI